MDGLAIKLRNYLFFPSALGFVALCCGCSARPPESTQESGRVTNYTVCALPADQGAGSLQGKWASLPIPVVIDRDFYTTDQGAQAVAIRNAINIWNDSWARLRGFQAFTISNDGSGLGAGAGIPVTQDCSQATITNARTDVVGIWKIQAGGDGKNSRVVNGTACKLLETGIQGKTDWTMATTGTQIAGASILLNYDEFNNTAANTLDLHSLVLHELGHVLGLLHSCSPGPDDSTTAVECGLAPERYFEAVMFPYLRANQIRRALRQNDLNRVNCLY